MVMKLTITKVLEPFLSQPKERLHLAAISHEVGMPHPTARQWLKTFEKRGVLIKEKKGRLSFYYLNYGHPNLIDYLTLAEKGRLIDRCEQDLLLKEITAYFHEHNQAKLSAVIFGSSVKKNSQAKDIDILVVGKLPHRNITALAEKLNKDLHVIPVTALHKVSDTLKNEIIKKHLILSSTEDFVRWLFW